MDCPDAAVVAATQSLEGNPAIAEHLNECPSCRLDWQIVHGARQVLYGQGDIQSALNDKAMARISRAQRMRRAPATWEHAISGILVATAAAGMLLLTGPTFSPPILPSVIVMLASGLVALLVFKKQASGSLPGRNSASLME